MSLSRLTPLFVAVVLAVPPAAHALSVMYLELDELTHQSDAVVIATVVSERFDVIESHGIEITETLIHVDEVLVGDAPADLHFRTLGGVIRIPGVEVFHPDERAVIFLRYADGSWWVTAMGQSKMTLTDGPLGEIATRTLHVAAFVRDGDGTLVSYRPPGEPQRLETLKAAVRAAGTSR